MSTDNSPATSFRPRLSDPTVRDLALRLYGLHVLTCHELDSYDDRNFHITVSNSDIANHHLEELCPYGYVVKVLNALDSKKPDVLKAKCDIILHAYKKGFPTPRPVPNVRGELYSLETLAKEQPLGNDSDERDVEETDVYLVRLFEYLPGTTLASVGLTPRLSFQVGRYAALMDKALQDFDDSTCPELLVDWNLQNVPSLRNLVHVIKDPEKVQVVSEVIKEFDKLMNNQDGFQKGIIHSDFNDHNILVQPSSVAPSSSSTVSPTEASTSSPGMEVCGILDFGDSTKSMLIVEVAIAMAYVILLCPPTFDPDEMAGHVLAGYLSEMALPRKEVQAIPLTVCARLTQSLITGHHKLSLDPDNEYIMVHANKVWPHLQRLWSQPCENILKLWRRVVEEHDLKFPED